MAAVAEAVAEPGLGPCGKLPWPSADRIIVARGTGCSGSPPVRPELILLNRQPRLISSKHHFSVP